MPLRRMSFVLVAALLGLSSCGLVKMPFRVAGAMVDGTTRAGKKAAKSTSDAMERRRKAKEAEKRAEEKRAKAEKASTEAGEKPAVPADVPPGDERLPPLPGIDTPLPDDAPLPYPDASPSLPEGP